MTQYWTLLMTSTKALWSERAADHVAGDTARDTRGECPGLVDTAHSPAGSARAELKENLKEIKEETLTQCFKAEEPWELVLPTVVEGPSVFKQNLSLIHILLSAEWQ